jgi:hypothetical protein
MNHAQSYVAIRSRLVDALEQLSPEQLAAVVPACPVWSVHELLVHVASMPMAIVSGDVPDGPDPNPWIEGLIARHRSKSVTELVSWWHSDEPAVQGLAAHAGVLVLDLFVHESDLHGAIGSIGHRRAPELADQLSMSISTLATQISATNLAPVAIETELGQFVTSEGTPGWTLCVSAWDAHRILNSRRTATEIRAVPGSGDPESYLTLIDEHLPLPHASLGEPANDDPDA